VLDESPDPAYWEIEIQEVRADPGLPAVGVLFAACSPDAPAPKTTLVRLRALSSDAGSMLNFQHGRLGAFKQHFGA
jgi:hypothetical protein